MQGPRQETLGTVCRKEEQNSLLITFYTLLEQRLLLEKRRPAEETGIVDLKKRPHELITAEKREKTLVVLTIENKDIRLETITSQKKTTLLASLEEGKEVV